MGRMRGVRIIGVIRGVRRGVKGSIVVRIREVVHVKLVIQVNNVKPRHSMKESQQINMWIYFKKKLE